MAFILFADSYRVLTFQLSQPCINEMRCLDLTDFFQTDWKHVDSAVKICSFEWVCMWFQWTLKVEQILGFLHVSHTFRLRVATSRKPSQRQTWFCLPAGGAVGGLLGCWLTSGQFKPLPQIIMELSPEQQQNLYGDLMVILGDIQWTDLAQLTSLVMGNAALKQQLTGALLRYITKELQANVHYVD